MRESMASLWDQLDQEETGLSYYALLIASPGKDQRLNSEPHIFQSQLPHVFVLCFRLSFFPKLGVCLIFPIHSY